MKILNLFASLGGNRYKWDSLGRFEITAVEKDPFLCDLYRDRFPADTVVNSDAYKFLLENYKKFDFVWASPPCPSHSRARFARKETTAPTYPDFKLYELIYFLEKWFTGLYVVENVIPYYKPLLPAKKIGRHLFWSNFKIPDLEEHRPVISGPNEVSELSKFHDFDFKKYKGTQRIDKIARNLVPFKTGYHILRAAINQQKGPHQIALSFKVKNFQ